MYILGLEVKPKERLPQAKGGEGAGPATRGMGAFIGPTTTVAPSVFQNAVRPFESLPGRGDVTCALPDGKDHPLSPEAS